MELVESGRKMRVPAINRARAATEMIRPVFFICSPGYFRDLVILIG